MKGLRVVGGQGLGAESAATRIGDQNIAPSGSGYIGEDLDRLRERPDRPDPRNGTPIRQKPQPIRWCADESVLKADQHL
jgi:hypothetical protein